MSSNLCESRFERLKGTQSVGSATMQEQKQFPFFTLSLLSGGVFVKRATHKQTQSM